VREGQAASHVIVEEGGNPVMLALRLKISGRRITEIETMVTRNRTEGALFSIDALTKPQPSMNLVQQRPSFETGSEIVIIVGICSKSLS